MFNTVSIDNSDDTVILSIDDVLSLDDRDVLPTLVSSFYDSGTYRDIVDEWNINECKKVCSKIGLPILNGPSSTKKMRISIIKAIQNYANGSKSNGSSDQDKSFGKSFSFSREFDNLLYGYNIHS